MRGMEADTVRARHNSVDKKNRHFIIVNQVFYKNVYKYNMNNSTLTILFIYKC
ncbi:hypothetical protein JCM30204_34940 [Dysgonomonas termitidis]